MQAIKTAALVLVLLLSTGGAVADEPASEASLVLATKLGLIQGHLWVAAELVEADLPELGARHAKHPAEEVYQELIPLLTSINAPGFADELEAMSTQFEAGSLQEFHQSYSEVMRAIDDIVSTIGLSDADKLKVAQDLVAQADLEYRVGVTDGSVIDLQEFQDARGFVHVAEALVAQTKVAERSELLKQIQRCKTLWPSLNPQTQLTGNDLLLAGLNQQLLSAAARR